MEKISKRDYEKSFEKFNQAMDNILMAESSSYSARAKELMHLIKSNYILYDFMKKFLASSITIEEVIPQLGVFDLPVESDEQIAVMFKFFNQAFCKTRDQLSLDIYYAFAKDSCSIDEYYRFFNRKLVQPCCDKLNQRFEDLIAEKFPENIQNNLVELLLKNINNAIKHKENDPTRLIKTAEREFCDDIRAIIAEGVKDKGMNIMREFPSGFAKKGIGETDFYVEAYIKGGKTNVAIGEVKKWGKYKSQVQQLLGYINRHTLIGFTIVLNQNNEFVQVQSEMIKILADITTDIQTKDNMIISRHILREYNITIPIYHFIANAYNEEQKQMAMSARNRW